MVFRDNPHLQSFLNLCGCISIHFHLWAATSFKSSFSIKTSDKIVSLVKRTELKYQPSSSSMHVTWMHEKLGSTPQWLYICLSLKASHTEPKEIWENRTQSIDVQPSAGNWRLSQSNLELLRQLNYLIQVSIGFLQCETTDLGNLRLIYWQPLHFHFLFMKK
jgi:hypothetical protein